MLLSQRAVECLRTMRDARVAEDYERAEIVRDGLQCWLGDERVANRTLNALIMACAVSHEAGGIDRFAINDIGIAIAGRPALADEVIARVLLGQPTGIHADGTLEDMEPAPGRR